MCVRKTCAYIRHTQLIKIRLIDHRDSCKTKHARDNYALRAKSNAHSYTLMLLIHACTMFAYTFNAIIR